MTRVTGSTRTRIEGATSAIAVSAAPTLSELVYRVSVSLPL